MKKQMWLFLVLLAAACTPAPTPEAPPVETAPERRAVFVEVSNQVDVRPAERAELVPAAAGMTMFPGSEALSRADGRARLDLFPEGTILRLGPNTRFVLDEIDLQEDEPSTRLKLLDGDLWIVLFGGALQVETPLGLAGVRGSMMRVRYEAAASRMTVACLEGDCRLENDAGQVQIAPGFQSEVRAVDAPPSEPQPVNADEVHEWRETLPEFVAWEKGVLMTPVPAPFVEASGEKDIDGPLVYHLDNNCPDRIWIWEFDGPVYRSFTLQAGESVSGILPPGVYTVTDRLIDPEDGYEDVTGPTQVRGGEINLFSCPPE